MKSIKPGRGPSMMGGIMGIFMIGFGILWTVLAAQASGIFALFGVLWTGIAVVNTAYNFINAGKENRYSQFDVVDSSEEPDPLNQRFGKPDAVEHTDDVESKFCPYCGTKAEDGYRFCNKCGKELP